MRNRTVTHSGDAAFAALADPMRRAVLDLLRTGHRRAGEIAGAFPVSRPAVSRHLRLLRQADLVREERRGRHRVYELNPVPLEAVDQWLAHYRAFWAGKLTDLRGFVEADTGGGRRAPGRQKPRRRAD
jgi:DNA-binding transcriptional ArsR family regulator